MPELTWTTALAWFGVLAGAASVAALILGLIGTWQTTRLQADLHTAMQTTMADIAKGFRESQQSLGQILERMDQRADDPSRPELIGTP
jgi:hypothetical protein